MKDMALITALRYVIFKLDKEMEKKPDRRTADTANYLQEILEVEEKK